MAMEKKETKTSRFGKSGRVIKSEMTKQTKQMNAKLKKFIVYVSSHCFE
jgi:hypothetical protein